MIKYVNFEEFLEMLSAGYQGISIEAMLRDLAGDESTGNYTVYWPKDSIRVIPGASYAVARTVAAVLGDPRTRYMGEKTDARPAEVSRPRRDYSDDWATNAQVGSRTVYVKDRLLPWDISVDVGDFEFKQVERAVEYRIDFSTVP